MIMNSQGSSTNIGFIKYVFFLKKYIDELNCHVIGTRHNYRTTRKR